MAFPKKKALLKKTLKLMKKSKLSVAEISKGTGFSKTWLHRLKRGDFPNPGVVSVETLHDYLMMADIEAQKAVSRVNSVEV